MRDNMASFPKNKHKTLLAVGRVISRGGENHGATWREMTSYGYQEDKWISDEPLLAFATKPD